MARRVGDSATWKPPKGIIDDLRKIAGDIDDLSPAMERGSKFGEEEITTRLRKGGDGDWPILYSSTIKRHGAHAIGVGQHGGFEPTLRRDWTRRNFAVFTRAPHAHLFGEGTNAHFSSSGQRVNVFNQRSTRVRGKNKGTTSGGGHVPKAQSRQRLQQTTAQKRQPARPFMYFTDALFTKLRDVLFDHVFGAFRR